MKKIASLFVRDWHGDRQARNEVTPGCEWVIAGEGVPTRKYDGTACMVRDGRLYKRYDAKKAKAPPQGFEPCQEAPDPSSGHWPGWVPVGDGPEDRWHREAWGTIITAFEGGLPNGTYELVGPKVQGGAEWWATAHQLVAHHQVGQLGVPTEFDALREYLARVPFEGIVWHHPDGRMAKVKRRDFLLPWPLKKETTDA